MLYLSAAAARDGLIFARFSPQIPVSIRVMGEVYKLSGRAGGSNKGLNLGSLIIKFCT